MCVADTALPQTSSSSQPQPPSDTRRRSRRRYEPSTYNAPALTTEESRLADGEALEADVARSADQATIISEILLRLSSLYGHQSRTNMAQLLLARAIAIQERLRGPESGEVADILIDMGWHLIVQRKIGRQDGAINVLKRALLIKCQPWLLMLEPPVREALQQSATAKVETPQAKLDSAEWQQLLSLAVQRCDDPKLSVAINRIAIAYSNLRNYILAENLFRWSLRLREQQYGINHPLVATAVGDLGSLYSRQLQRVTNVQKERKPLDIGKYTCSVEE